MVPKRWMIGRSQWLFSDDAQIYEDVGLDEVDSATKDPTPTTPAANTKR